MLLRLKDITRRFYKSKVTYGGKSEREATYAPLLIGLLFLSKPTSKLEVLAASIATSEKVKKVESRLGQETR